LAVTSRGRDPEEGGRCMFYQFYEWNHAALQPWRALAEANKFFSRIR
jgi:hypothetical protein